MSSEQPWMKTKPSSLKNSSFGSDQQGIQAAQGCAIQEQSAWKTGWGTVQHSNLHRRHTIAVYCVYIYGLVFGKQEILRRASVSKTSKQQKRKANQWIGSASLLTVLKMQIDMLGSSFRDFLFILKCHLHTSFSQHPCTKH